MPVKWGIIGLGHIGRRHAELLLADRVPGACLHAVATTHPDWIQKTAPSITAYRQYRDLLRDPAVECILICTPHRHHVPWAKESLQAGKHVLIEKPLAADWRETEELCRTRDNAGRLAGVMFMLREHPAYRCIREILTTSRLGRIHRVLWTMTAWYRDQDYFDNSVWRGTWDGEGGGVLLNQCAHQLDLLTWYFGMPSRLTASCAFGKYHRIEVEDEASLLMDYANGVSVVFIASSGEPRGQNRLEIIGEDQTLILNNDVLYLNGDAVLPESVQENPDPNELHARVIGAFSASVRNGRPPAVSVEEAALSLQLANAAIESAQTGRRMEFPLKS